MLLTSSDQGDDFELIALGQLVQIVPRARDQFLVHLDGNLAR
jgi:hypothetical protein